MAENDVEIKFGASIEALVEAVNGVNERLESVLKPVKDLEEGFRDLRLAVYDAFAVEQFGEWVDSIAELGEQTKRTADEFGVSAEQVGELNGIAKLTGTSAEQLTQGFAQLQRGLTQAQHDTSQQAAALRALGLSTSDLIGLRLTDQLDKIAEKFALYADGTNKAEVAMALFGRAGVEMIPFLDQGAAGFDRMKQEILATGDVLSDDMAERFEGTQQKLTLFGDSLQGLGIRIFDAIEPLVDQAAGWGTTIIEGLNESQIKNTIGAIANDVLSITEVVGQFVLQILGVVQTLSGSLSGLANQMKWAGIGAGAGAGIGAFGAGIGAVPGALIGGGAGLAAGTVQNWIAQATGHDQPQQYDFAAMTANFQATMEGFRNTLNAALNHPDAVGDRASELRTATDRAKPHLPNVNLGRRGGGANEAMEAARLKIEGEMQVLTQGLQQKRQLLDAELQTHQISDQQWVQQSGAAVNSEYDQEKDLLEKELQLAGLKLTQRQELLNKLTQLEQKHAADIMKINQKAAEDYHKTWTTIGDAIAGAMNAQMGAVLKGTESIGKAVENIGLSLLTTLAENALKSIVTSAAQSFAGVFAFLAPSMGPAALGPAAAAQATVMAAAGTVASAAVGTWRVPGDMLAMIHQDETIMPAFQAGQFRDAMAALPALVAMAAGQGGAGSGGGDVHNHFHGAILDGRELLRQLGTAKRLNAGLASSVGF